MDYENDPAHEGEAGVLFTPANAPAVTTKRRGMQRRIIPPLNAGTCFSAWEAQIVPALFDAVELVCKDLLGPVHLLGDDGGPRVVLGYQRTATFCWLERRPWGATWANANKQFIDRDHVRHAVCYALKLAGAIRKMALAEQARLERAKTAYLREKFGGEL